MIDSKIEAAEAAVARLSAHLGACDRLVRARKMPLYAKAAALREQRAAILALRAAQDELAGLRGSVPHVSIVDQLRARREERLKRAVSE